METWCELFMRCDQIEDFPRQSTLRCFPVCYRTVCAEYIRTPSRFGPCQITFNVFPEISYLPFKLSARSKGLVEKSDKPFAFFFFFFLPFPCGLPKIRRWSKHFCCSFRGRCFACSVSDRSINSWCYGLIHAPTPQHDVLWVLLLHSRQRLFLTRARL